MIQKLIYYFLLSAIVFTACKGQEKSAPKFSRKEDSIPPTQVWPTIQSALNNLDNDPYFVETKEIDAPFGPSSITRNIVEDQNGNLWLATWEGIVRYDGKTFTNFTNKEGLRRYHTFAAMEDRDGNLWFGSIGAGVYRYDGKKFTNFTTKDGLADNSIGCIFQDKSGDIWIGTFNGASRYDGRSFTNYTTKEGMDINTIIQDKTGKIWFGTRGFTYFYDGKSFTNFKNEAGLPFNNVRSIIEDKNSNLWLGGQDGLYRYDGTSFSIYSKEFIGFIYEDSQGVIWTCGGNAAKSRRNMVLSRIEDKSLPVEQPCLKIIKEEQGQIFGIMEDSKGRIWYGTERGICRYDRNEFAYFFKENPTKNK